MSCENCDHCREGWGPGPWDSEPDRYWFTAYGFPCLLHRNPHGAWCGYVAVPPGHATYRLGDDDLYKLIPGISVHGGITYADFQCENGVLDFSDENDWVFGFDCCHAYDYWPMMGMWRIRHLVNLHDKGLPPDDLFNWKPWDVYRDFYYAEEQVIGLARHLSLV